MTGYATSNTGETYGGSFQSDSSSGNGMFAVAIASDRIRSCVGVMQVVRTGQTPSYWLGLVWSDSRIDGCLQ